MSQGMVEAMTKGRESGRIDEELVCFDSLVQRLREIDSTQKISDCDRVPQPEQPPDFWITIAGVKYAVEVTSIVTDADYDDWCKKLIKAIRSEFVASNDMKGEYALSIMRRPDIPRKGTTDWRTLISTAATKIREMSNARCGAESRLLKDANGYLEILKTSDQGSTICRRRVPAAKWEGEVQKELAQLIKDAIDNKRGRLERKGILHQYPIILLFYDAYGYSDIEDVQKALQNVQDYEWLHSIFWAASFSDTQNILYPDTPGRKGVFLYSKNKEWH